MKMNVKDEEMKPPVKAENSKTVVKTAVKKEESKDDVKVDTAKKTKSAKGKTKAKEPSQTNDTSNSRAGPFNRASMDIFAAFPKSVLRGVSFPLIRLFSLSAPQLESL